MNNNVPEQYNGTSGVLLKQSQGGCRKKYMDHTLDHAHFCIYESNALVTNANVKK